MIVRAVTRAVRRCCWAGAWLSLTFSLAASAEPTSLHSHVAPPQADPQRIIALEFLETEIALALELPLVGVADKEGYRRWVDIAAGGLEDVTSVGGRAEPNLEQIIRLQPDLIVGSSWRHGAVAETLDGIAPLLLYRVPEPTEADQFGRMRAIVRDLAARTGRESRGRAVLDELDEYLQTIRARLAEAGYAGAPVVFGQVVPGNDRIRLFTDNSLVAQVIDRLGLRNAWEAPPGDFGYQVGDIGDLGSLSADVHLVLAAGADSESYQTLTNHRAWQELALVRAGRAYRVERDVWPFGGPYSAMRIARRLAETLTGEAVTAGPLSGDSASATR